MSSVAVPSPIIFDLSVSENIRIRKSLFGLNGGPLLVPVFAANGVLAMINAALRLYRHDPLGWIWMGSAIMYVCFVLVLARGWLNWQALFIKPQRTRVAFTDVGLEIERSKRSGTHVKRFVRFAQIRWARSTPDALVLSERFFPLVMIPKTALADNGQQIMRFLEHHLVGGRSLRRGKSSSTIIINTASP